MATDRGVERNYGGGVMDWRVLAQALMRAMAIEVTHVLVEDGAGVSFVVEQQPVGALLREHCGRIARHSSGTVNLVELCLAGRRAGALRRRPTTAAPLGRGPVRSRGAP
jgi:hypothetical protein